MSDIINKKRQTDEIRRCAKDPLYFFNNYVKISHPLKGPIPFRTFPFQDDCVKAFLEHRFVIVNKSRQLGLSTLAAAYAAWLLLFHRNKEIIIMATKLKTAMNFVRKVKFTVKNLPKWLVLPKYDKDNDQTLIFGAPSHSRIEAIATSTDAGRSEALSLLIVDEAAHVADFEELWKGLYPTLSTGGRALIISTPKGVGNWFHKLWKDAEDGNNDFFPISLPWDVHPERDQTWFENETSNMSEKGIAQELLCVGGETRIITKGGFKRAVDVVVGDEVLTHLGRFKRVLKCHERAVDLTVENVYAISTPMNRKTEVVVTGNHPLLSVMTSTNKMSLAGGLEKWMQQSGASFEFHAADDLVGHNMKAPTSRTPLCLFPRFDASAATKTLDVIDVSTLIEGSEILGDEARYPRQWGSSKRFVKVDYDLGRFVGLWVADGYANPNDRFGLGFGFHIEEYGTLLRFVDEFMQGYGARTRPSRIHDTNGCRIETHNQFFVKLMRFFVDGRYAHDKLLKWDVLMQAGPEFIRGLLVGYFEGDGDHHPAKKLKVVSVHSQLLYQVRTLLSMFGHYPRIGHWSSQPSYLELDCVAGRKLDELLKASKDVMLERAGSRTRLTDGFFVGTPRFHRINDEIEDEFRVFNFEVEDDHTYVADSIVVHNCDFLASGDTYLDVNDIAWVGQAVRPPVRRDGPDRNVWIWQEPIKDPAVRYVIPADVGRGDGKDFSTFHVLCVTTGEVVAEFRGKLRPDLFAGLLFDFANRYNRALLVPEKNTYGHHVIIELVKMGYTNIYFKDQRGVFSDKYIPPEKVSEAGFDVQRDSRKMIVQKLEEVIRNKQLKVFSSRLYEELKTFISHNDKPQAQKNCHDDLVMALAIGAYLFDASGVNGQLAAKLNAAVLSGFGVNVNSFDNMAGTGNEVIPSWTGMVPYTSNGNMPQVNSRRRRPRGDDPSNVDWLF